MKIKRKIYFVFLVVLFTLPLIGSCYAQTKEYYVGINENDVYIYITSFNKDPYEKFCEDKFIGEGEPDNLAEQYAEVYADALFNTTFIDEDFKAYKIYILKIREEEKKYYGEKGVSIYLNFYVSEDRAGNDWELEKELHRIIYKYDKSVYKYFVTGWAGLYPHLSFTSFTNFFYASNVNWDQLADKIDDEFSDSNATDADANPLPNGIETSWEENDETDELTTVSRYSSQGVLTYYEWAYDGDIIMKFELELNYFTQYWILILIFLIAATIPGIILLIKDLKE